VTQTTAFQLYRGRKFYSWRKPPGKYHRPATNNWQTL